ncbi:MAG: thymidylate synthase [Candidatus Hodarchaeota archaeon]
MKIIKSPSIIKAWKHAIKAIKIAGNRVKDEDVNLVELFNLFLSITNPRVDDKLKELNPEMHDWMKANFEEKILVPELKNAKSYGYRLRDHNGKDQVKWVVEKLKKKRETKSATITTLMPSEDEGYIPCVSLLDFKIRDDILIVTVTCRSLDFGKKAIYNLLELTKIGEKIKTECKVKDLLLNVHVISAHIYEDDLEKLEAMDI